MNTLTLYTTIGCHLCTQAIQLLASQNNLVVTQVEIADSDKLLDRYGASIPVIRFTDNSELKWPFTLDDIDTKLKEL